MQGNGFKGLTICILILYRLFSVLLTRNYEYPDEHWQGPEIAHKIHYGYGYLTWQWTVPDPLRNPVYPYLLSLPYYITSVFAVPIQYIHLLPQLLIQIPLAVFSDIYLIKMLKLIYSCTNVWMYIVVFGNWAYFSTIIRTYANSFQTCLTIVAAYYWIKNGKMGASGWYDLCNRALAIISYVGRPTSIMIWALLWPYQLYEISKRHSLFSMKSMKFILKNIQTIIIMIICSFAIGSLYNSKPTSTQLNFIKVFLIKWSQLYGIEPFYFYILLSTPFMVNFGLISVVDCLLYYASQTITNHSKKGRYKIRESQYQRQAYEIEIKKQKAMNNNIQLFIILSIVYLLINSFSTHKEHRFILPIIPFILIISAAPFLNCLSDKEQTKRKFNVFYFIPVKLVAFLIIFTNVFTLFTFNFWGKSDGVSAWNYIGDSMGKYQQKDQDVTVVVMGEAHFMHGYSVLHRNITYRIPDASAVKMAINASQNRLLYQDPYKLYDILTLNKTLHPTYIIAQGKYLHHTAEVLAKNGYRQTKFWRHCTILEQIFIGFDSISIFESIHKNSLQNNVDSSKSNLYHQGSNKK